VVGSSAPIVGGAVGQAEGGRKGRGASGIPRTKYRHGPSADSVTHAFVRAINRQVTGRETMRAGWTGYFNMRPD